MTINMIDLKVHTLEDNKEYCELYNLEYNDNNYLLLIDETDPSNICFRKIVVENNTEYLEPLLDDEFDVVYNKLKEEFKEILN